MIQNRDCLLEFMKDNIEIDEYIPKMLLDGEKGVYAELVAFSELYNIQISVLNH